MPLAIEHAGVYIRDMQRPIAKYIERFNEVFEDIHKEAPRETPVPRRRTMASDASRVRKAKAHAAKTRRREK